MPGAVVRAEQDQVLKSLICAGMGTQGLKMGRRSTARKFPDAGNVWGTSMGADKGLNPTSGPLGRDFVGQRQGRAKRRPQLVTPRPPSSQPLSGKERVKRRPDLVLYQPSKGKGKVSGSSTDKGRGRVEIVAAAWFYLLFDHNLFLWATARGDWAVINSSLLSYLSGPAPLQTW